MGGPSASENALQYFAHWNGFVANDVDHFMRIDSVSGLKRVKKSGKIGIMIGLQNSEHFRRPDDVDFFRGSGPAGISADLQCAKSYRQWFN